MIPGRQAQCPAGMFNLFLIMNCLATTYELEGDSHPSTRKYYHNGFLTVISLTPVSESGRGHVGGSALAGSCVRRDRHLVLPAHQPHKWKRRLATEHCLHAVALRGDRPENITLITF